MDVFCYAEFRKLKYINHTVTFSRLQRASALSSAKAGSINTHLLEAMAVMDALVQIKTENIFLSNESFICML